jgi:HSP20 family protein
MAPVIRKSDLSSVSERRTVFQAVGWQVRSNLWSPPTDFYETDDAYVVRVEIAGMTEDDFTVNIEENTLVITGARPDVPERRAYHQMEIRYGKFTTAIGVPGPIDLDRAIAEYDNGFLTVTLPRAKPSHIKIQD